MSESPISPYRKRFNTQIISKTEIALEAIRRYDMEQSKSNFFNYHKSNEKTILSDLDQDYSMLTSSRKVEIDRIYKINLVPHSQQFYSFDMANHVFPLRVLLKNVRSDGIFYAGYDHQYPGVVNKSKKQTNEKQASDEKNYDYKIAFNKDILITLKNKNNKPVKVVYFSLIAGSELLMIHLRVESLGFSRDVRFASQVKLIDPQKGNKSTQKQEIPVLVRQKTEPIQIFKQFTKSKFPEIARPANKLVRLQQFQVFTDQMPRNSSKSALSPTLSPQNRLSKSQKYMNNSGGIQLGSFASQHILRKERNGSGNRSQKSDVSQRLQEIKRNRCLLQVYKQKDKQLRETASKCKKLIQDYKKIFNQQNVRKCKTNRSIVLILYSMLYINSTHQQFRIKSRKAQSEFKITYLCKKFINKLKKKHNQSYKMIPYRLKRTNFEAASSIYLQSKLINRQCSNIASNMIQSTLFFLMPMLSINKALDTATIYRNKLKLIQRTWKSKYHNRMYSLHYFIDNHVERMVKQYPHLKLFFENFYKSGANKQIALNYIKDESEKYRFIYEAYLRKLEQIEQMTQANKKLMQQGSKKPKLTIPKKPLVPMHRFYRNCDILKSMVRAWFEIQYKKYFKKSFPKYTK